MKSTGIFHKNLSSTILIMDIFYSKLLNKVFLEVQPEVGDKILLLQKSFIKNCGKSGSNQKSPYSSWLINVQPGFEFRTGIKTKFKKDLFGDFHSADFWQKL